VDAFLQKMNLDPNEIVSVEEIAPGDEGTVVLTWGGPGEAEAAQPDARRTVYKLFTQYLDLFGKPSREFLKKLFPFAEVGAFAFGPAN
ncbi:unnamed protein product, partial [Effrenium voratum]